MGQAVNGPLPFPMGIPRLLGVSGGARHAGDSQDLGLVLSRVIWVPSRGRLPNLAIRWRRGDQDGCDGEGGGSPDFSASLPSGDVQPIIIGVCWCMAQSEKVCTHDLVRIRAYTYVVQYVRSSPCARGAGREPIRPMFHSVLNLPDGLSLLSTTAWHKDGKVRTRPLFILS